MARNEEKAQSMLFRFREAQAAELGLSTRQTRRPRMASSCNNLRDAEKWRGEILRDISRKVSKIQDAGLTDYEVRDLNDEINKLLREKGHWERQIVALGGANYRRSVAMTDEDGKEVPGTRGYKYFGRAKDLPGVKELFQRSKDEKDEASKPEKYRPFMHQGPAYYGDLDEDDGQLLDYEAAEEEEGWNAAFERIRTVLSLPKDATPPAIPRTRPEPLSKALAALQQVAVAQTEPSASAATKRPAPKDEAEPDAEGGAAEDGAEEDGAGKRAKADEVAPEALKAREAAARKAATASLSFLDAADLEAPKMPSKEEMEKVLLDIRKKALLAEYGA